MPMSVIWPNRSQATSGKLCRSAIRIRQVWPGIVAGMFCVTAYPQSAFERGTMFAFSPANSMPTLEWRRLLPSGTFSNLRIERRCEIEGEFS
jgi:hypothetical protein